VASGEWQAFSLVIRHSSAGWLDRCGGPERGPRLTPTDYPTVESVRLTILEAIFDFSQPDVKKFICKVIMQITNPKKNAHLKQLDLLSQAIL
jgi:hypothetical protein